MDLRHKLAEIELELESIDSPCSGDWTPYSNYHLRLPSII